MKPAPGKTALVLGGGGARAAYHAGFLRRLGELLPEAEFRVLTGVSAGAINTAGLASGDGPFSDCAAQLAANWEKLTFRQAFRADWSAIGANMVRWFARLLGGGSQFSPGTRSLLDNAPLRRFLAEAICRNGGRLRRLSGNVKSGRIDAVAIVSTNYTTGISTSWVESRDVISWLRPGRVGFPAELTLDHVMASCALPLFFPAVCLANAWHGDGGIRQTSPLSPAIHLGAERILAFSIRPARPRFEFDPLNPQAYPSPAGIIGMLLDAAFLDVLEQDALHLERVNALVGARDGANANGLRPVNLLLVRPSIDLAPLAAAYEDELPHAFRFAIRGLGTRETTHSELLATLMFSPGFIREVMTVGARDAEARHEEIRMFLRG